MKKKEKKKAFGKQGVNFRTASRRSDQPQGHTFKRKLIPESAQSAEMGHEAERVITGIESASRAVHFGLHFARPVTASPRSFDSRNTWILRTLKRSRTCKMSGKSVGQIRSKLKLWAERK